MAVEKDKTAILTKDGVIQVPSREVAEGVTVLDLDLPEDAIVEIGEVTPKADPLEKDVKKK